jgi:hypothetical protein
MIHVEPAAAAISMNPAEKERSHEEGSSNVPGDDTKKSERKRQRERQRRSDLATAFDELASLVGQIDPDEASTAPKRRRQRKGSLGEAAGGSDVASVSAEDPSAMTRLDLIQRTIEVLRRLQRENALLRQRVEQSGRSEADNERVSICSRFWMKKQGYCAYSRFQYRIAARVFFFFFFSCRFPRSLEVQCHQYLANSICGCFR